MFSWIFLFLGVIAVAALLINVIAPKDTVSMNINFMTVSATFSEDPILYLLIVGLFILASFVSCLILFRHPYAYATAIAYSFISLAFLIPTGIAQAENMNEAATEAAIVAIVFGSFLIYLLKKRSRWTAVNLRQKIHPIKQS